MRIISQDGLREVEYESCGLAINPKCCEIEAYTNYTDFTPVMASYSSVEKCKKALEMLREAYMSLSIYKTMSESQRALSIAMCSATGVSEKEQGYLCGVFQFPDDSEIEV